jgi:sugar/nucleoside kinase (ribokinase family)
VSLDCLSAGILVVDHLCAPIARLPVAGELVMADRLPLALGGCAANVAIDLVRVGLRAGVAGCVGRDALGRFFIDSLAAQGIDPHGIREVPQAETSGSLILNVADEDRRFIHCSGANAVFQATDIPWELVRQAKILYVGGYLLMPALERADGLAALFREARRTGVVTMLDVVVPGPGEHWNKLEAVLAETDVFLPNADEGALITGLNDPVAQAERFRSAGAKTVVITLGNQGALLVADKLRLRAGTYPTEFVGGTGAGDAFVAGYVAGLVDGRDPLGCLQWGAALGASCVRAIGATESVFTRAEAEAFLKTHELSIERL